MSNEAPSGQDSNDRYGTRGPKTTDKLRDKELLNRLYHTEGLSQAKIGERLGCGSSTVSRWLRHHGIETHPAGDRTPFSRLKDREWLVVEYSENENSLLAIADKFGCHDTTVLRWLHKHGIETREAVGPSGEDCPAYIDGRSRKRNYGGYIWQKARNRAIRRDGHECQRCGCEQSDHVERYGRGLEAHHIVPFREFDDREKAHELSNLITLCRPCHKKLEGLPIDNRD